MIEGTEVIWSAAVYIPTILCGIVILSMLEPILAPFLKDQKPLQVWASTLFLTIFAIAAYFAIRHKVWAPIRAVYSECGDRTIFNRHCEEVARKALPYAIPLGVAMSMLCMNLGEWWIFAQIAVLLTVDRWVEKRRQRPILNSVDALLAKI